MLQWLDEKLQLLNPQVTKDENGGYTRLGFSNEEQLAINAFIDIAQELNMTINKDSVGNVIAIWHGTNPKLPHIALGSHVDTVKNGGGYDGVAGVLAGLGAIKQLKSLEYKPKHSIEVICFVTEESSRFGVSTIGSKAMTGQLDINNIKGLSDKNGITVEKALSTQGINLTEIGNAERKQNELHSFVELHIEQGIILEDANCNIGVVTGVASPLRYKVEITGEASHTGTTPMDKRKDALAAAGRIITFIEELGKSEAEKDHFVATVTTAEVTPNVMNVIPESVTLGIDIRSTNNQLKQESEIKIKDYCHSLSDSSGVQTNLVEISNERAVLMDQKVMSDLKEASKASNKSYMEITSGAGHDAMNMALKWPSGMIFIPCKNGVSHHPNEFAKTADILHGADVLANYIKLIDERMLVSVG